MLLELVLRTSIAFRRWFRCSVDVKYRVNFFIISFMSLYRLVIMIMKRLIMNTFLNMNNRNCSRIICSV